MFTKQLKVLKFSNNCRCLYSASSLGIDAFLEKRKICREQFKNLEKNFKDKMNEFSKPDSNSMIFTEDLKHAIYLAEDNEADLRLVRRMLEKFSKQDKGLRFGSFVFGPVVMRMYYNLNKAYEALATFNTMEKDGFFDQISTYQILMDLLLNNGFYDEVIKVFNTIKNKNIGKKYPKNPTVLVLAACYKLNTSDSYKFAKELWLELKEVGHKPMRRAGVYTAALALRQKEPEVGLEVLSCLKNQSYVTVRNLRTWALCELGRPDDALRTLTLQSGGGVCDEVLERVREAVDKAGNTGLLQRYEGVAADLRHHGQVSSQPLDQLLWTEISTTAPVYQNETYSLRRGWNHRPGLKELL